jgi:hypothetical protein
MIISVHTAGNTPARRGEALNFWKRWSNYSKKKPEIEDSIVVIPCRKKLAKDLKWQALVKEMIEKEYTVQGTL